MACNDLQAAWVVWLISGSAIHLSNRVAPSTGLVLP